MKKTIAKFTKSEFQNLIWEPEYENGDIVGYNLVSHTPKRSQHTGWNKTMRPWPPNYTDPVYRERGIPPWLFWTGIILVFSVLLFMLGSCTQKGTCPTYSNAQKLHIKLSSVQPEMTRCHVIEAWGHPVFVNQKIVDEDTLEELVFKNRNVYMKNGLVCSVKY